MKVKELVVPGSPLGTAEEFVAGDNAYEHVDGSVRATSIGFKDLDEGNHEARVQRLTREVKPLERGSVVKCVASLIKEKMVSKKIWDQLEKIAIKLFTFGQKLATKRGLILVDTKYEFGLDKNGNIILIDEIHTPDSSRWWKEGSQDFMDKEFLRLWFKDHCDPYKDKVLPSAPPAMIAELSRRYIEIYQQLTGKKFRADLSAGRQVATRIEKNLKKYQTL